MASAAENQQTVEALDRWLGGLIEFSRYGTERERLTVYRAALRDLVAQAADTREMLEQPQRHDFGLDGMHNASLCSVCALLARLDGAR